MHNGHFRCFKYIFSPKIGCFYSVVWVILVSKNSCHVNRYMTSHIENARFHDALNSKVNVFPTPLVYLLFSTPKITWLITLWVANCNALIQLNMTSLRKRRDESMKCSKRISFRVFHDCMLIMRTYRKGSKQYLD